MSIDHKWELKFTSGGIPCPPSPKPVNSLHQITIISLKNGPICFSWSFSENIWAKPIRVLSCAALGNWFSHLADLRYFHIYAVLHTGKQCWLNERIPQKAICYWYTRVCAWKGPMGWQFFVSDTWLLYSRDSTQQLDTDSANCCHPWWADQLPRNSCTLEQVHCLQRKHFNCPLTAIIADKAASQQRKPVGHIVWDN